MVTTVYPNRLTYSINGGCHGLNTVARFKSKRPNEGGFEEARRLIAEREKVERTAINIVLQEPLGEVQVSGDIAEVTLAEDTQIFVHDVVYMVGRTTPRREVAKVKSTRELRLDDEHDRLT